MMRVVWLWLKGLFMRYLGRSVGFRLLLDGIPSDAVDLRVVLEGQRGRVLVSGDRLVRAGGAWVVAVEGGVFGVGRLRLEVGYMVGGREVLWGRELDVYLVDGGVGGVVRVAVGGGRGGGCCCGGSGGGVVWWEMREVEDGVESGERRFDVGWVDDGIVTD